MKTFRSVMLALLLFVFYQDATASIPECYVNEDCADDKMCITRRCENPCLNTCGDNSICNVTNHIPVCVCTPGFIGNPVERCLKSDILECSRDEDCPTDRTCHLQRCEDPCPAACGKNTACKTTNHTPTCVCFPGFTGNPEEGCLKTDCSSIARFANGEMFKKGKYYLVPSKKNWFEAFQYCQRQNRRLAVVTSEEENEQILELIDELFPDAPDSTSFWVGATDIAKEGHWMWMSTGELMEGMFMFWHPGNPSNHANSEHCLDYWKDKNSFMWNDNVCSREFFFICENLV